MKPLNSVIVCASASFQVFGHLFLGCELSEHCVVCVTKFGSEVLVGLYSGCGLSEYFVGLYSRYEVSKI